MSKEYFQNTQTVTVQQVRQAYTSKLHRNEMIDNEEKEFMFQLTIWEEEWLRLGMFRQDRPLGVCKINSKNVTKAELEQMFQWNRINNALFLFYPQFFFHLS